MEEKFLDISIQLNTLESLSRILLESIIDGENLKQFDTSNLAKVVLANVIKIKDELNEVEIELGL